MSDIVRNPLTKSSEASPQKGREEHAVFLGWQRTGTGKAYPLYNVVVEGHPYFGSTVSDTTLRKLNLGIPKTPSPPAPASNESRPEVIP